MTTTALVQAGFPALPIYVPAWLPDQRPLAEVAADIVQLHTTIPVAFNVIEFAETDSGAFTLRMEHTTEDGADGGFAVDSILIGASSPTSPVIAGLKPFREQWIVRQTRWEFLVYDIVEVANQMGYCSERGWPVMVGDLGSRDYAETIRRANVLAASAEEVTS